MKIKKINISRDKLVGIVQVGAFVISAAAGIAAGWVGEQKMKTEVANTVSQEVAKQLSANTPL